MTEFGLQRDGQNIKIEIKAIEDTVTEDYIAKITLDDRCYDSRSKVLAGLIECQDFEQPFEFAHKPLGWVVHLDFKKNIDDEY